MEDNQPKTGKFSLQYGLILGAISVAFGVMLFVLDAHTVRSSANQIISLAISFGVILWGILSFRKANEGY